MSIHDVPEARYRDRDHAGEVLAGKLLELNVKHPVVCAVPNGGVPVAVPVARRLQAPLRLMIVRKLQFPDNPEAGFGAVTSDGFLLLNRDLMQRAGISQAVVDGQKEKALRSIRVRKERFGATWTELPPLREATVILVDDGLASGFTMEAAVASIRSRNARSVVVAVPTAPMGAVRRLEPKVNRVLCPHIGRFRVFAVADAYENWYDVDESEVMTLLESVTNPRPK